MFTTSPSATLWWLMLVLVAIAGFSLLADSASANEPGERRIVLRPGLNAVGWVGDETFVSDVFAELPEASAVYAWDALNQRYLVAARLAPASLWTLETVTPGMGILVSIEGDAAVEWRIPLTPVSGTVRIFPGMNLVAWSGRDNTPLAHALRGVGTSIGDVYVNDSGAAEWSAFAPSDSSGTGAPDLIDRGEALWVFSARRLNWLQPTYVLPQITADISDSDKARVLGALGDAGAFFDRAYGIQADPARLLLAFRNAPDWPHAGGGVDWFPSAEITFTNVERFTDSYLSEFVAHEYAHVLQGQLDTTAFFESNEYTIGYTSVGSAAPWWMKEGGAYFVAEGRYGVEIGLSDVLQHARLSLSNTSPPLRTLVRRGDWTVPYAAYSRGALAMQQLTAKAGDDSLFEFWRVLAAPDESPIPLEELDPAWQSAFKSVFGVAVDDFYNEFREWHCAQAVENGDVKSDDCAARATRLVRGALYFNCGLNPARDIRLLQQIDGAWTPLDWWLTDGGYFALAAPADGLYVIEVKWSDRSQYFGVNGINAVLSDAIPYQVDRSGIDVKLSRLYRRTEDCPP